MNNIMRKIGGLVTALAMSFGVGCHGYLDPATIQPDENAKQLAPVGEITVDNKISDTLPPYSLQQNNHQSHCNRFVALSLKI